MLSCFNIAARIPDILLLGRHTKSGTGAILLLLDGKWRAVCRKGNDRSDQAWGSEEATVACRQLGYYGGWPTKMDDNPMVNLGKLSIELVDDFRCLGSKYL